eukprot:CAMPEP_0184867238 /NCGR_PEP_ID=MMETSP0580-20130426/25591_1 /TAXON_ID=1118495 /ORGANISM="Dactyliosolen fragilissimus" /LENGTH=48 /DNA_ID= /DNA_START= /DNA_END= /DNA_ORIENTATION=
MSISRSESIGKAITELEDISLGSHRRMVTKKEEGGEITSSSTYQQEQQ